MSSLLNIANSGLNAAQIALNVVGQNIANVNTVGYSRQEAQFRSLVGFGSLDNGQGVEVSGVRRISDDYLVSQQWRAKSSQGYAESFHQYINVTEQLLGSESMSISLGYDSFFASLSSALDSPETPAQREQIVSSANALTNRFRQLSANLATQERQINEQLNSSTTQVNSYLKQVAALNTQIRELAAKGGNTSQLEDSRDQVVRELSSHIEVRVNRQQNGDFDLSLPHGEPLVLSSSTASLEIVGNNITMQFGQQAFKLTSLGEGSIGGLMSYRSNVLNSTKGGLDTIAKKLADEFNAKQLSGLDLAGAGGVAMFTYDQLDIAGTISVASGFTGSKLAFAQLNANGTAPGPGDNRNLQAILTIKDSQYDAYSALVGKLAVQSGQAKADVTSATQLEQQISDKVSSVSGVNSDEEGIKLMAFTRAYQANAKVISTADQLFDSLLGMF